MASRIENMTWWHQYAFPHEGLFRVDSRSFNVAELSPFDLNLGVAFLGRITNLTSDVLPFTVTICPNEQGSAVPCLLLDVLGNGALVLKTFSDMPSEHIGIIDTYTRNKSVDGSTKQCDRRWVAPVFVARSEVCAGEMPGDGGHGHAAISPWWTKIEFKRVILDVFVLSVALSKNCQRGSRDDAGSHTYRLKLPSRQMARNGFGYGWLLRHTQYSGHF